jgi:hypothetical protein
MHSDCARFLPLIAAALFGAVSLVNPDPAAAGIDVGTCEALNTDREPRFDDSQERVADLQSDGGKMFIVVSPFRSGVSAETIRWLFLRQCAFAERFGSKAPSVKLKSADHERADCAAARMMNDNSSSGRFELRAIQNDLEMVDDQFWKVNLGGRRFVDLEPCAGT